MKDLDNNQLLNIIPHIYYLLGLRISLLCKNLNISGYWGLHRYQYLNILPRKYHFDHMFHDHIHSHKDLRYLKLCQMGKDFSTHGHNPSSHPDILPDTFPHVRIQLCNLLSMWLLYSIQKFQGHIHQHSFQLYSHNSHRGRTLHKYS